MTDIQLRNIDPDQLHQLEELAAEQGQPVDAFVATLLADILRKRTADREKGLGSRIAKRFENLGLEDGDIEELRGHLIPRQNRAFPRRAWERGSEHFH